MICSELGRGSSSEAGKYLIGAANVWWRCAQYFVIRCMYMAHACFYICCSDCVGVCGNVCCIAAVVKDSVFKPWSVEVCCMFV